MASTSASSALVADAIKSEDVDIKSEDIDIKPEYTDDELEAAIRSALRTNVSLSSRGTSTTRVINHNYLTVAKSAGEALGIDSLFFYKKPWWQKLMEIVNAEIVSHPFPFLSASPAQSKTNSVPQTTLSANLLNTEERRIEDALRVTVASFVCTTTTVDGTTSSVIDYAGIYRAVEAQLGLGIKALSHNARYKVLRRAVVKEEVAKIEAVAARSKAK